MDSFTPKASPSAKRSVEAALEQKHLTWLWQNVRFNFAYTVGVLGPLGEWGCLQTFTLITCTMQAESCYSGWQRNNEEKNHIMKPFESEEPFCLWALFSWICDIPPMCRQNLISYSHWKSKLLNNLLKIEYVVLLSALWPISCGFTLLKWLVEKFNWSYQLLHTHVSLQF